MSDANAISDLERAEHLGYADGAGVKRVSVYNDGVQINAATEETIQAIAGKAATKVTVSGTTTFVASAAPGSLQSSAVWAVQKIDESSGVVVTWADGNTLADNVATDLTALTYS